MVWRRHEVDEGHATEHAMEDATDRGSNGGESQGSVRRPSLAVKIMSMSQIARVSIQ